MKRFLLVLLSVLFVCNISFAEDASSGIKVGDYIRFGRYEQDNILDNGPEEIEWLVVEAEEEKCCLVSKYILDAKPYHDKIEDVNWETCWLRNWLNEEFIQTAFSAEEQKLIPVTHAALKIYGKPDYYTDDKIYLLSYEEAFGKYFRKDWDRNCEGTPYAIAQGLQVQRQKDGRMTGWYWLRSFYHFTCIQYSGRHCEVVKPGLWIGGVRPVLWMKLK